MDINGRIITDTKYPDGTIFNFNVDVLTFGKIKGDVVHFLHKTIVQNVVFPERIKNGGDWEFFARIAKYHNTLFINKVLKIVEYTPTGLTTDKINRPWLSYRINTLQQLFSLPMLLPNSAPKIRAILFLLLKVILLNPTIRPLKTCVKFFIR